MHTQKLAEPLAPQVDTVPAQVVAPDYDVEEAQEIVFRPNKGPQTTFLSSSEREVLYGGAAGGGKSYAMLADPLHGLNDPNFSGLLVRHTTEELRELIQKSQELYPRAIPGIKWSERKSQWISPKGGRLWMSYLDKDTDVTRYQGQAFNWIGFDELTQWPTPYAWDYMRSRLRSAAGKKLGLYMRATTNPGGAGHAWVKKMFIDPAPTGKAFWATDIESNKTITFPKGHSKEGQPLFKRRFIPASLFDIHTLPKRVTMRPCSYHYQSIKENNSSKETGILAKEQPSQSLIEHNTLLTTLTSLNLGHAFVHVIMVMVATLGFFGLLWLLMSSL